MAESSEKGVLCAMLRIEALEPHAHVTHVRDADKH